MENVNKDNLIFEHILNISKSLNDISNSLQNICILFKEKVEKSENGNGNYEISVPYKNIIKKLENRNIRIKKINKITNDFDNIAVFMGNNYNLIKNIYILMKRDLNLKTGINLFMKNNIPEEISATTNLCLKLYNIGFLDEYNYFKSPKFILNCKTGQSSVSTNFLTGGWFERYVFLALKDIFEINGISEDKYEILTNVHIILSDNNIMELDILVYYNNKYFYIEVKTGDYRQCIKKYTEIVKILNFDMSFFIHTDINNLIANQLTNIMNMYVININNMKEILESIILLNL